MFSQQGRIGSDMTDQTQNHLQNTQYLNRVLSHYFSDNASHSHIQFATQCPGVMVSGTNGGLGLGNVSVEDETSLFWNTKQERSLEKVQLLARPFLTVPYLGRGSCDPTVESQLLMGETVRGKKSVSTVMEDSFHPLEDFPLEKGKQERTVEETALNGWVRGGTTSRESGDKYFSQKSRPTDLGF
jgi:hypothetical protein